MLGVGWGNPTGKERGSPLGSGVREMPAEVSKAPQASGACGQFPVCGAAGPQKEGLTSSPPLQLGAA